VLVVLRWAVATAADDDARRATADALLRRTVAALRGVPDDAVVVTRRCPRCGSGRHGAPQARVAGAGAGTATGEIAVSVSRAGGLTVVAACDAPVLGVGVDVEPLDRPTAGLAAVLDGRPGAAADDELRRWVRVEAVLKAAGVGLAVDPGEVAADPGGRVTVPASIDARGWWLVETAAVPGCAGAVALRLDRPVRRGDVTLDVARA